MAGNGWSSWPTAKTASGGYEVDARRNPPVMTPPLQGAAEAWVTPNVPNGGRAPKSANIRGRSAYRADGSKMQIDLQYQVKSWSTPSAHDGRRPGADLHSTQDRNLSREAANWPTPSVMLSGERTSPEAFAARQARLKEKHGARTGNGCGADLAMVAKTWPSPTARMWKGGGQAVTRADGKSRLDMLDWAAEAWNSRPSLHLDLPIPGGDRSLTPIPWPPLPLDGSISGPLLDAISDFRRWSMRSGGAAGWRGTWTRRPKRQLSPRFAEWLMRWPIGWSGFGSLETGLTPWLAGMRGFISTLDTARAANASRQGELL
jgi:hypothetical protein